MDSHHAQFTLCRSESLFVSVASHLALNGEPERKFIRLYTVTGAGLSAPLRLSQKGEEYFSYLVVSHAN